MRLTSEQAAVCKLYSSRDPNGIVHCAECPMVLDRRYSVCLKNVTKKEAVENWNWNGDPFPG